MINYKNELLKYINTEIAVLKNLNLDEINIVMNLLEDARKNHRKIYICGNGGSASTASHFCCDFNKGACENLHDKYDFECLNDNVPTMMAIANDINYDEIFRFVLQNKLKSDDILIGISGSGNSQNIINAFTYAKEMGSTTISLVGYDGGKIKEISDYCIHVKINNMQIAEDLHMMIDHLMMFVLSQS